MEEMEQTRLVQRDTKTGKKQVSMEGMEQQVMPVGGIRESRIGPGIYSKIVELKRVGVGGSGEKRKRVREGFNKKKNLKVMEFSILGGGLTDFHNFFLKKICFFLEN